MTKDNQGEWVSVVDRLPKHTDEVLVWRKSEHRETLWYCDCAAYGFFGDGIWGGKEDDNFTVTHWMPLPSPPTSQPKTM